MARALKEVARVDRQWFRAHPERRHRCRWPDTIEFDVCDSARGARLVIAIRHLGRGHIVYQPAILRGALPRDERSAAALFALAATSSEPISVMAPMDVLGLRSGLSQQCQSQEEKSANISIRTSGGCHVYPDSAQGEAAIVFDESAGCRDWDRQ
jgi:hypothetical protein